MSILSGFAIPLTFPLIWPGLPGPSLDGVLDSSNCMFCLLPVAGRRIGIDGAEGIDDCDLAVVKGGCERSREEPLVRKGCGGSANRDIQAR